VEERRTATGSLSAVVCQCACGRPETRVRRAASWRSAHVAAYLVLCGAIHGVHIQSSRQKNKVDHRDMLCRGEKQKTATVLAMLVRRSIIKVQCL
jgi:hypothetical protein